MAISMVFFRNTLLFMCLFFTLSCFASSSKSEMELVGSTPGDEYIKTMLSISSGKVDFINWKLKLTDHNFVLTIAYGESQPNTMGLMGGGSHKTIKGKYSIKENQQQGRFKQVYVLTSDESSVRFSFVKLNENIFHMLTSKNQLMGGNGGWSYSLNRAIPVASDKILIASPILNDKSSQLVFDGRTPCQEFAADRPEMKVKSSCFKLKWSLTLNRDSLNYLPTTCIMRKLVDGQARNIPGKWTIEKGTPKNPDLIIYKIYLERSTEPISFLVGDQNVLFFLDGNNRPLIGNKDYSFALNRK